MTSIWDLANPQLRDLAVYEPGKPIEETARELGADAASIIKLASNENPLGPSPKALAAMREALECAHLYPDGGGYYLRAALAAEARRSRRSHHPRQRLERDHRIHRPRLSSSRRRGHHAASTPSSPTRSSRRFSARRRSKFPRPDFQQDLDAIADAITPQHARDLHRQSEQPDRHARSAGGRSIASWSACRSTSWWSFDEAYYEYVDDPPDTLKFVREGRNVIVLRTFSKIHGLASAAARLRHRAAGVDRGAAEDARAFQRQRHRAGRRGRGARDDEHQRRTKQITDEGRTYLRGAVRRDGSPIRAERREFRPRESRRRRRRFSRDCCSAASSSAR